MKPTELSNSDFEMQVRKSYIKPGIERVNLVPEETVLGGCKADNVTSGMSNAPHCGLYGTACSTPGS